MPVQSQGMNLQLVCLFSIQIVEGAGWFVRVDDIGVIVDLHCLEVFVRFVDIGVIVDHHCLNFLVIM